MPPERPAVYRLHNAGIAQWACAKDTTELGLADLFGVSSETIARWIATIPAFAEAVRRGSAVADAKVEAALFAMATGYDLKKTEIFLVDGKPHEREPVAAPGAPRRSTRH